MNIAGGDGTLDSLLSNKKQWTEVESRFLISYTTDIHWWWSVVTILIVTTAIKIAVPLF